MIDEQDRKRLRQIMEASKRGQYVSDADSNWCQRMYRKHPKEYGEIHASMVEAVTASMNPLASFGGTK